MPNSRLGRCPVAKLRKVGEHIVCIMTDDTRTMERPQQRQFAFRREIPPIHSLAIIPTGPNSIERTADAEDLCRMCLTVEITQCTVRIPIADLSAGFIYPHLVEQFGRHVGEESVCSTIEIR